MGLLYLTFSVVFSISVFQGTFGMSAETAIVRFFQYFKQEEPKGIPVLDPPDPMELFSPLITVPVVVNNGLLYGHTLITIHQVYLDFVSLSGDVSFSAPVLEVTGDYSWESLFDTSNGQMYTNITEPKVYSNFTMSVDDNHILKIDYVQLDIDYEDVSLNFTELLFEQELILSTGLVVEFFNPIVQEFFRQLQPYILGEINGQLENFFLSLPSIGTDREFSSQMKTSQKSFMPLFIRRLMLFLKLDPLKLPDKSFSILGIRLKVSDLILEGSSFTTNIERLFTIYKDKKIYLEVKLTYPRLRMMYTVSATQIGLDTYDRAQLNNVRTHLRILIDPSQKHPPKLYHLDLVIGSFGEIRSGRRGFFENLFKKVFDGARKEIIKALSSPIKNLIQKDLNTLNLEEEALRFLRSLSQ